MKVVILAGGKGTRLSQYTKNLPKPMVKIGSIPIIVHIINFYIKYGFHDFIIAGGYKYKVIKKYFYKKRIKNIKIKVLNTGLNSLTGTRIKKLKKYLKETFMLTYGDGLSDINLNKLYTFHKRHKKKITITAVRPPARFGELRLSGNAVISFKEKPQLQKGWINGGFFIVEPNFLNLIDAKKNVMLERDPLQKATKKKSLMAFKHSGFWFCMDTLRDKNVLDKIWKSNKAPWA